MQRVLFNIIVAICCCTLQVQESFGITIINQPVTTPFGKYTPESQPFTPAITPYTLPDSLKGVLYSDRYSFSDTVKQLLIKNGFAAVPSDAQSLTAIYKTTNDASLPVFVTTDLVLHCFFKVYENMLKIAEYNRFYSQLDTILEGMITELKTLKPSAGNDTLNIAFNRTAAFLDVAHTLLTDSITFQNDSTILNMVQAEIPLVYQHKGFSYSNVLPQLFEDFSQYVPRGHYSLDDKFKRYFMSMMYLGRMNFRDTCRIETIQACILTRLLSTAKVGNRKVSDLWAGIYTITSFFAGKSDDLNYLHYASILDSILGSNWRTGSSGTFSPKIKEIMTALQKQPRPMILSGEDKTGGFRIMGQRFVPDSYLFGRLVFDYVGTAADPRLFPRGLDVFASLGSQMAREHLLNIYHENSFLNYTKQLDSMTAEFTAKVPAQWAENLYWNWLYTLVPLLQAPGKGYPSFMSNQAWVDKSLITASGSWAELRHATILYAKQSYTPTTGIPCSHSICFQQGYVEPNPEVFGRLAAMVAYVNSGFTTIGLSTDVPVTKLDQLFGLCKNFQTIAIKELEGKSITINNYCDIANAYKVIADVEDFKRFQVPPSTIIPIPDSSAASIVDVHTDMNSSQVLEVGTGKPMCLYVVVPVEGKLQICRGAMFSYYEFKQPMSNRLTDDQWRTMLNTTSPLMPEWTRSFTGSKVRYPFKIWEEDLTGLVTPNDSIPGLIFTRDSMVAFVNSDDTLPTITLELDIPLVYSGKLVSGRQYRFSIPSEKFRDTTAVTITSRINGPSDIYCGSSSPKIPISYRKIVIREVNTAAITGKAIHTDKIFYPYMQAGRLVVPANSEWRIIDGQGRQVVFLKKGTHYWVPSSVNTHKILFVVPAGKKISNSYRIVMGF